jgi:hypothetical protein
VLEINRKKYLDISPFLFPRLQLIVTGLGVTGTSFALLKVSVKRARILLFFFKILDIRCVSGICWSVITRLCLAPSGMVVLLYFLTTSTGRAAAHEKEYKKGHPCSFWSDSSKRIHAENASSGWVLCELFWVTPFFFFFEKFICAFDCFPPVDV